MKALVLESQNGRSIVLAEDGTIRRIRGRHVTGDQIEWKAGIQRLRNIAAAAAAAACLVTGIGVYSYENVVAYAAVRLEGTAAIEVTLNRRNRVIQVTAIDEESQELAEILQNDLGKITFEDVVEKTMQEMEDAAGIPEYAEAVPPDLTVEIRTKDGKRSTELRETVERVKQRHENRQSENSLPAEAETEEEQETAESAKPETKKSEAADAVKPEVKKSETADAVKPEAKKSETADAVKPEIMKSEAADAVKPEDVPKTTDAVRPDDTMKTEKADSAAEAPADAEEAEQVIPSGDRETENEKTAAAEIPVIGPEQALRQKVQTGEGGTPEEADSAGKEAGSAGEEADSAGKEEMAATDCGQAPADKDKASTVKEEKIASGEKNAPAGTDIQISDGKENGTVIEKEKAPAVKEDQAPADEAAVPAVKAEQPSAVDGEAPAAEETGEKKASAEQPETKKESGKEASAEPETKAEAREKSEAPDQKSEAPDQKSKTADQKGEAPAGGKDKPAENGK